MPDVWVEDGSVSDGSRLWRAIPPESMYPADPQDFSDSIFRTHRLSAYIVDETTREALVAKFPACRFREFTAKQARDLDLFIVRETDDDGDESHVVVVRADAQGKRISNGCATKLKKVSKWADVGPGQFPPAPGPAAPIT